MDEAHERSFLYAQKEKKPMIRQQPPLSPSKKDKVVM